jgi:hypothetical protein
VRDDQNASPSRWLEVGPVHSTVDAVEGTTAVGGDEACGGKGPARKHPVQVCQASDTEPTSPVARPRAGEQGMLYACPGWFP